MHWMKLWDKFWLKALKPQRRKRSADELGSSLRELLKSITVLERGATAQSLRVSEAAKVVLAQAAQGIVDSDDPETYFRYQTLYAVSCAADAAESLSAGSSSMDVTGNQIALLSGVPGQMVTIIESMVRVALAAAGLPPPTDQRL